MNKYSFKHVVSATLTIFGLFFVIAYLTLNLYKKSDYNKYIVDIKYDSSDITEVYFQKMPSGVVEFLPVFKKGNRLELNKIDIKDTGSINFHFKSKKFGSVQYVECPIMLGRRLEVNCIEGRIVISVFSTGYL